MKRFRNIGIVGLAAAAFALADSWSGTLVAGRCKQEPYASKAQPLEGCSPTSGTKVFAVMTPDGKVFRLDEAGNKQALAAIKEDPNKQNVTVSGSFNGQTLQVDSIDIH
jgi:hypothetical protein